MKAKELYLMLKRVYSDHSLFETNRNYLGMSGAGECPCAWYWRTVKPTRTPRQDWSAFVGYMYEARVLQLLGAKQERREIVAAFDERYRGHTDHVLDDDTLIEVKSVPWERYLKLLGKGDHRNKAQCQAYMRHGRFPHAVLIYVARDIPWAAFDTNLQLPFFTIDVYRNEAWMDELDEKAKMVLICMDRQEPPACTCGYCRR